MSDNYAVQNEDVQLPLSCGRHLFTIPVIYLHKAVKQPKQEARTAFREFYYLGVRKLAERHPDTFKRYKEAYEVGVPRYAERLAEAVVGIDAVATLPSSPAGRLAQEPYKSAVLTRYQGLADLSAYLSRPEKMSSTDEVPCVERLESITFAPPPDIEAPKHVLLIDDVLQTGVSAAASVIAIRKVWGETPISFTLLCPLWIIHEK